VETDLAGNVLENYIFFNAQRVARRDASTKAVHFYFSDHLGTHSLITDASGDMPPQQESDYYPYGGEIPVSGSDPNRYKFTGKERDAESGLDYFGARHDASTLGRFMQPDPGKINLRHALNPQKWNKYAYSLNNPLRFFDPDGMVEMEVQFRAFIQQQSVKDPFGRTFAGDNRGFTVGKNVSSRTTISVRIETDPSKRPGNPIISATPGTAGPTNQLDANGNVIKTGTATTGLPQVTGSRDANGNAVLNFTQNTQNPLENQTATPGIRANVDVTVAQNGSWTEASGMLSATPSFELNTQDSSGHTTNIPLQTEPSGGEFGLGLFVPMGVDVFKPTTTTTPPPPPECNGRFGCPGPGGSTWYEF
jgi:RHS repeat-associated protein